MILHASEGMWLTQTTVKDERNRTFTTEVTCSARMASRWTEVTDAYKQAWEAQYLVEPEPDNGDGLE